MWWLLFLKNELFPAHAGMNRSWKLAIRGATPVPRTRGMNRTAPSTSILSGSVPRTRGDEPLYQPLPAGQHFCSPAHAGMNR